MKSERIKLLYSLLIDDLKNTEYLFGLEAKEVVSILNKKGYDFTEEELIYFVDLLKKDNLDTDEISNSTLDDITGGVIGQSKENYILFFDIKIYLRSVSGNKKLIVAL